MITRVRLKNWKSHLDSEFRFSEGVNTLVGIMGSGKSSITQGICFALFGTFPALQSRRITLDDLIMKKPRRKDRCEIEVDFVVDGSEYSVKRVVEAKKGTTLAEVFKDKGILDETPSAVTRAVESALQMDYELFSRAVYSEQNGLDHFLRIPRGHRMQQIDEMLRVDKFEKAREDTVSLANKVRQRRDERMRIIADLEKEDLDEKMKSLGAEISKLNAETESLQKELEGIRKEKEGFEKSLAALESKESELNKAKQDLQGIRSAMSEVDQSIEAKKKRLEEFGDVSSRIEELKKGRAKLKAEFEETQDLINKTRDEIASVNSEIKLVTDNIKELENVEAKCHVCESPVSEDKKKSLIGGKKAREQELRKKATSLAAEAEKHNKVKAEAEVKLRESDTELARLETVSYDANMIKEMGAKREAYAKQETALSAKIGQLESDLAETDVAMLRQRLTEIAAKESEASTRLSGLDERLGDKRKLMEELEGRKGTMERYRKDVEQDAAIVDSLRGFVKVLKITQEQLREEFLRTVNGIMESIWKELYPYGDFKSVRLCVSEGDYVLQLRETPSEGESWVSVDGTASGGERSMACLALRIAFSIAFIPNLKWLILDEPTHNLDSNAISQFSETLKEKINQFVDQVFIITHEERISESVGIGATGTLHRLERDKEANEPTRIKSA